MSILARRKPLAGNLHLLVFHQPAHQFGARVFGFVALAELVARQQHARLDLDQHRRHHQIVGRQLQIGGAHGLDVIEVLSGQRRHRDIEYVDIGTTNHVEQQVERPLEGVEHDRQRIGRNVQVER